MAVFASDANIYSASCFRKAHGVKLRRVFQSNISWINRYEFASLLKGHGGCVNTIRWSTDAQVLCSGSDDRHVNLWRFDSSHAGTTVPPQCSVRTAHRHNIFDAHLTRSQQQVVSCGADGCICVTQVENSDQHRRLLYEPDAVHVIAAKIEFMKHTNSDVFLATFGDGFVRMFDLREPDHRVAVTTDGLGLTGIELQPTNHMALAIGGNDPFLRIYDLRSMTFSREDQSPHAECNSPGYVTPAVSIHTVQPLLDRNASRRKFSFMSSMDVGISGVSWSSDGRLLLANYRNFDVVLFDMLDSSTTVDVECFSCARGGSFHEHTQTIDGCERIHLNAVRTFKGRVNDQTCAKEVRFLCGDAAVGTGGDCGNFFIWETATGKLQRKLKADRCVVNCVAPHPCQPMVCTSGIDSEIKVWDVGNERVACHRELKRSPPEEISSTSDWGRRRRESATNATVAEAEERLQSAELKKARGNTLVKRADWDGALEEYQDSLQELHFLPPNGEIEKQREALANSCRLNCALCCLSLQEYSRAVEYCSKVLQSDESSLKALFRRASALGEMREFDRAFQDIEAALALDPGNTETLRLRSKLQKQQKHQQRRERDIYKRIFSESAAAAAAADPSSNTDS